MLNFGLAQKLSQRGGGVKAQKKIEEVIQTDPKFPDAYALLGQIILTENQQKDDAAKEPAKQAFEKALELDPNLPVAMIGKAHFLLLAGDFDGAVALAKNALSKHAWGYAPKPSDEDIAKLTARLDEAAALRAGQKEAEAKAAVSDVLDGFVILRKTTRSKMHIPGQNAEKPAEAEAKSAQ
jgi:predicted Zn-dependent protease